MGHAVRREPGPGARRFTEVTTAAAGRTVHYLFRQKERRLRRSGSGVGKPEAECAGEGQVRRSGVSQNVNAFLVPARALMTRRARFTGLRNDYFTLVLRVLCGTGFAFPCSLSPVTFLLLPTS